MLNANGDLLWKSIVYDTLDASHFEATDIWNDTIYFNMDYQGVPSLQYSVLEYSIDGTSLGRHDYYYPGVIHRARGLAASENRLFVHFMYKVDENASAREVVRVYDKAWNALWELSIPNTFPYLLSSDIKQTSDDGVVIIYSSQNSSWDHIATIEKYNCQGVMEWRTEIENLGRFNDGLVRIDCSPDGGYIGTCKYDTFALYVAENPNIVFKLDSSGNIQWQRLDLSEENSLYDVFSASNGDIIGCGIAENWHWNNDPDYRVAYVIRLDSQGERIWDRKIAEETDGAIEYELYSGTELGNGDLVFTGLILDTIFGTPEDPTPANVWVLKLDSLGCIYNDCEQWQYLTGTKDEIEAKSEIFAIYPNPASDRVTIGSILGVHIPYGDYILRIFDIYGHILYSQKFNPNLLLDLDVSDYPPAMYYITISRNNSFVQSQKLNIYR